MRLLSRILLGVLVLFGLLALANQFITDVDSGADIDREMGSMKSTK
jgi:hypothetical protein